MLTPVVIGRKYLPLHPVAGTVPEIAFKYHFFVAHFAYPRFWEVGEAVSVPKRQTKDISLVTGIQEWTETVGSNPTGAMDVCLL